VIGCEFACFFGSVGVPVTVIEMLPEICPQMDKDITKNLRAELSKKNVTFHTGAKVLEITADTVRFEKEGKPESVARDIVLVSTGRMPNVNGLGLEELRLDFDQRGIKVDDRCATNVPGIWAAGDCTGKAWLAHTATRMGEVAVNNMSGRPDRYRSNAIPGVVYTVPEIATVGLGEDEAKKAGIPVKVGKMPMSASGRYLAEHADERGQVKVILHAETGVLLGVHMIGGACSEMIWGAAALIEAEFRAKEIEEIVFPHPTVSELIRDTIFTIH
jgi:dihydrolipoamide dehydrogenase